MDEELDLLEEQARGILNAGVPPVRANGPMREPSDAELEAQARAILGGRTPQQANAAARPSSPGREVLTVPPASAPVAPAVATKTDPIAAVRALFTEYDAGPKTATTNALFSARARAILGEADKQSPEAARYADLLSQPPSAERNAAFVAASPSYTDAAEIARRALSPDAADTLAGPERMTVASDAPDRRVSPFARRETGNLDAERQRLYLLLQQEADPQRRDEIAASLRSVNADLALRDGGAAEYLQQFGRGVAEIAPALTDAAAVAAQYGPGGQSMPLAGGLTAQFLREGADTQREFLDDVSGVDPVAGQAFPAKVARGLGSTVPFVAASALTGGSATAASVLGAAQGAGSEYRAALRAQETAEARGEAPVSNEDVAFAALLGGVVGSAEGIPLGRAFHRANEATGGAVARFFTQMVAEGGEEFAQETLSAQLNDAAARATYDPSRPLESHFEDGLIGLIAGGVTGGGISLASGAPTVEADPAARANVLGQRTRTYGDGTRITPDAPQAAPTAASPMPTAGVGTATRAQQAADVAAVRWQTALSPEDTQAAAAEFEALTGRPPTQADVAAADERLTAATSPADAATAATLAPTPDADTPPPAVVASRPQPLPQAAVDPAVANPDAPAPAVEPVGAAAATPAELSPETAARVAQIEAVLPLVPEVHRPILEAELARLTNGYPDSPTPDAPIGDDVRAERRQVAEDGLGELPRPNGGAESQRPADAAARPPSDRVLPGNAAVDSAGVPANDGRPAVADQAVTPAAQPTGPKRRINRGMNPPVYVRFEDPLHAALYDYGSSIGSRSGRNPTAGQKAGPERRARLIEMGVPETEVEALAREEYNAVRAAAKAGEDDATITPPRLYRPEAATEAAEAVTPRPTGYGARNRGVTLDALAEAKAVLAANAGQLNANPVPSAEVLRAWGQIAAFHVEAGAREFADFAARLIEDGGDAVRPYLRDLYDEAQGRVESEPPSVDDLLAQYAPATPAAPATATPSVDDLLRQYAPETAAPEPRTVALNTSAIAEARELLNLSDLAPEAARRWEAVLAEAEETGQAAQADDIALDVLNNPRAVSDVEHAALVLGAAQKQKQHADLLAQAEQIEQDGGDPTYTLERARAALATLDRITEASDRAGREAARALSIRRLRLNAETFEIAPVLRQARADKGAPLTPAERERLSDLVGQVEAADRRVRELEAQIERTRQAQERRAAERAVASAPKPTRESARDKIRRDRAVILDELKALGLRVSDVTGLTIDGSILVGRLALNFAKEGALTLQEVVGRVQATLPDLTADEIVGAIAAPKRRVQEKTEAELTRARVERSRAQKAVRAAQRALAPRSRYAWIGEILGAPRALMATGDMSAVLRQGAILLPLTAVRNPKGVARAFAKATGAFFRDYTAEQADVMIRSDPRQYTRDAAGLYLAPVGDGASVATINAREETFMSRWLQASGIKATIGRAVAGAAVGSAVAPGPGTAAGAVFGAVSGPLMRMSERHYGTFLNLLRVAAFDYFADTHPDADAETLRSWADYVNKASGRGNLGQFSQAAPALSGVFFAPRFMVSRFQTLAKPFQPSTPAAVRKESALSLAAFVGTGLVALTLAKMGSGDDDAEIGLDPRSPDFGKLKIGDTRIDVWASEQQVVRLVARTALLATDHYGITEGGRRTRNQAIYDPGISFLKFKLAPTVSVPNELATGRNAVGEKTTATETLGRALLPLGITETYGTYQDHGPDAAAAVYLGNFFGVGVSVYDK